VTVTLVKGSDDVLRGASATATSEGGPLENNRYDRMIQVDSDRAQMFTVSEPYLQRVSLWLESDDKEELEVRASLYRAEHLTDFSSTDPLAVALAVLPPKRRVWVTFPFEVSVEPGGMYWVKVDEARRVSWGVHDQSLPGALRAERMEFRKLWLPRQGCHTFRLTPEARPYVAGNVVSGGTRPERGPEMWVSDPGVPLPQSVDLKLAQRAQMDTVYFTFDTNLDSVVSFGPAPECVRDYTFYYRDGDGEWEPIVRETDNHQRLRRHQFPAVWATEVRLTVTATNGDKSARVYEVRAYLERPDEQAAEEPETDEASVEQTAAEGEEVQGENLTPGPFPKKAGE